MIGSFQIEVAKMGFGPSTLRCWLRNTEAKGQLPSSPSNIAPVRSTISVVLLLFAERPLIVVVRSHFLERWRRDSTGDW